MTDILGFGYAALIAIGGAMGYLKAGNVYFHFSDILLFKYWHDVNAMSE